MHEQPISNLNYRQNYRFKRETWAETASRVAEAVLEPDRQHNQYEQIKDAVKRMIREKKGLPGGRVLANAGTDYDRATLINCFVSGPQGTDIDSIEGIMNELKRCAKILASEGGYGFNANWMRPRNTIINGTGARTPGAVEMLSMWDQVSTTLTKGPEQDTDRDDAKEKIRKGAMMVTMSLWHPDVIEFIEAKQKQGRLSKFNMSVLASDRFMEAKQRGDDWDLVYPDYEAEPDFYERNWDGDIRAYREMGGSVRVHRTVNARDLWNQVMQSTYNRNEPGVLFVDTINDRNPLYYTEKILASNPCGEQVMPTGASCDLGNLVLPNHLEWNEALQSYEIDWGSIRETTALLVRVLDNVNDVTYFPLPEQQREAQRKRRIGVGHMGFGSALMMLGVRYGSDESVELASQIQRNITYAAYQASMGLAVEKEPFPAFDAEKYVQGDMVQRLGIENQVRRYGLRNSHLTSIQPTGNTSIVADNVSGGLEPVFAFEYKRTMEQPSLPDGVKRPEWSTGESVFWTEERQGDEVVQRCTKNGYEAWQIHPTRGIVRDVQVEDYAYRRLREEGRWDPEADWAVEAHDLDVEDHVRVMKAFAEYIDSAMSKTVNLPEDYDFADFKNLYTDFWKSGVIKGGTTYREGTMSAVLSSNECPNCGSKSLVHEEGCETCQDCGWSKCEV